MSFATIVLCDLYNMTKMIFVVNVIYDWKLVTNIDLKKPFFTNDKTMDHGDKATPLC
jgi:hypothetical protein